MMDMRMVQTQYGALRGVRKQTYTVFRGVPYAKPPVGALRWQPPQRPDAWEGVRQANAFGPRGVEFRAGSGGGLYGREFFSDEDFIPPESEDCLYLNVWTPAEAPGEKLPVALWIHGGGFTGGFGTEIEFDGAAFCAQGVILVTCNYRLGALGFLAHPWLQGGEGCGNWGLLDQIAALRWVRENIEAFGGDPERIMLFGQSAGAMSVQALVSTRHTQGMIASAILQSGGGYRTGFGGGMPLDMAMGIGERFAAYCGVDTLAQWRAIPAEKLAAQYMAFCDVESGGNPMALLMTPVIDGVLLEAQGDTLLAEGRYHDIPYMIGSTSGDIFGPAEGSDPADKGPLYNGCVGWSLLGESLGRQPSYVYYFTREPLGDDAGAFHSCELWYEFGTLHRSWRPKDAADWDLSRRLVGYVCNFARAGNPNGEGLPAWRPCSGADPNVFALR